jgi:hypothetical protein
MKNNNQSEQSTSGKGLIWNNKELAEVHQGVFSIGLNWHYRPISEKLNLTCDPKQAVSDAHQET